MAKETLIVGAGIVGSALAFELSRRGVDGLRVVDADLEGSFSSTERNAGGVRHLWQQPINSELARRTIQLIETHSARVGFQPTGYLWLYRKGQEAQAQRLLETVSARGLSYESLSVDALKSRYPYLDRTDDLALGLFGKKDGLINSNSLKEFFREGARERGVVFESRAWVTDVASEAHQVRVRLRRYGHGDGPHQALMGNPPTAQETTETFDRVILAGGAWLGPLLKPLVGDPLIQPIRRQICVFKSETFDLSPYGMVVDPSGVYFHPEGGNILAGLVLKEEAPGLNFSYDASFFEDHIWPALYERSSHFERLKWITGWGGLYSYTPDTTGILGAVPGHPRIFEAHSFTGRGVMQSYGAAVALSELMVDGRFSTLDGSPLHRNRFKDLPKESWLHEGLHI